MWLSLPTLPDSFPDLFHHIVRGVEFACILPAVAALGACVRRSLFFVHAVGFSPLSVGS